MAAKKAASAKAKAAPKKRMSRAAPKRMPKKQKADTTGLEPLSCALEAGDPSIAALEKIIEAEGGLVVGRYKDPLGGHPLVTAILPVGKIEPTPFQRDLSDTHHKRLADVIQKTGRFLDPVVAITSPKHAPSKKKPAASEASDVAFWTPNGRHRLEAMRRLGAKAITALVVPTREIAWQILALNTEKAHNLKERALEVVRIYRGLLEEDDSLAEKGFNFYLEDPALVTIGVCYEKNGRFAGGAYHPILRRLEEFSDDPIKTAIKEHEKLADLVLELEVAVSAAIQKLKEKGFVSPYLRAFVVSRINPLRWIQGDLPSAEKVLTQMRDRALKFKTDNIKQDDLAKMGGGVPDEDG